MDIYQNDISDILKELPQITDFNGKEGCDILISTLGFEDRAPKIAQMMASEHTSKNTDLILIRYSSNLADNKKNYDYFKKAADRFKGFREINFIKNDFIRQFTEILKDGYKIEGKTVIFDISSCSSYVFYPTIRVLFDLNIALAITYTEAIEYYPTQEEWKRVAKDAAAEEGLYIKAFENAKFQSIGVNDVYCSPIFSEMNPGNKPTTLIAVPNFSALRMNAIIERDREINKTSFENIIWIIGSPPAIINKWRTEALEMTNNLRCVKRENLKEISTFDYKEILFELEDIWNQRRYKFNFSIGDLGSKMQHLGIYLFLYLHQDVGVWLAEPKEFKADRFSHGSGESYFINFKRIEDFKKALDKYMKFEWKY